MKKNLLLLPVLLFQLFACDDINSNNGNITVDPTPKQDSGDGEQNPPELTKKEKYKLRTEDSILPDFNHKNGFFHMSSDKSNFLTHKYFGMLDYGGERETSGECTNFNSAYWQATTWGSAYTFMDEETTFKNEENYFKYENPTRSLYINKNNSEFTLICDADEDYRIRYPETGVYDTSGGTWSHFLIEEEFPKEIWAYPKQVMDKELDIHVTMDFTLDEVTYKKDGTPIGADCAQLLFYTQLRNDIKEGQTYEEYGSASSRIWFGVPLYDTRYKYISQSAAPDILPSGEKANLIYSMDNRSYLGNKGLEIGKTYHIDVPIMDSVRDAFIYGVNNKYLPNMKWENVYIGYMNFGWEIKGNYKVKSTFKNLDIYIG